MRLYRNQFDQNHIFLFDQNCQNSQETIHIRYKQQIEANLNSYPHVLKQINSNKISKIPQRKNLIINSSSFKKNTL